jgi:hypothetical protein
VCWTANDDDDASPLALPPGDDSEDRMPPVELGIRFMSMYENMVEVVNGAPRCAIEGSGVWGVGKWAGKKGRRSSLSQTLSLI